MIAEKCFTPLFTRPYGVRNDGTHQSEQLERRLYGIPERQNVEERSLQECRKEKR